MLKEIRFLKDKSGNSPAIKWLTKLKDRKVAAIINARLARVAGGNYGDHRYIDDEICEFRIHLKSGYRIYFVELEKIIVLILLVGSKKTQKKDIQKATKLWHEFKEEQGDQL
jgi:putative addiction module killer protein